MAKKVKKIKKKKKGREILVSKKEGYFFGGYVAAGLLLAVILLAFGISFGQTLSKFYGFLWMFFVPGLFIFRAAYQHKVFDTYWEEYGYPVLISWILHSLLIAGISGFFKTAITDLNLYGSSLVLALISVGVFYYRKNK